MSFKTVFQGRIIRVEVGQMQFPHGRNVGFEVASGQD
jgi:hypothetical protein